MKFKSSLRAFLFGSSLFATNSLQAINYWWDIDGASTTSTAATGTWSTGSSANWTTVLAGNIATSAVTTTNADDLTMYATGMTAGTITLSGTQAANSITFNTATTIASSGGLDLGSASGGSGLFFANVANTINAPITLNSAATSVSVINRGNQAQTLSSTSTISGSGGGSQTLIIGGTGASGGTTTFSGIIGNGSATSVSTVINALATTNFSAANTYTGSTSIFAGTLSINNVGTFNNTSAINLYSTGRLTVNAANASLAKLRTAGGGTGVTAGSFLRYSTAQTTAGSGNGPGTIFGTVELNLSNVNPNYTIDLGTGGSINNVISANYASPITLSGNAAIEASPAVTTHTAT
jgi:hypothetical protein